MTRSDLLAQLFQCAERCRALQARWIASEEERCATLPPEPAWIIPASVAVCIAACSFPVVARPWLPLTVTPGMAPLSAGAGVAIWLYARLRFSAYPRLARLIAALLLCSTGLLGVAVLSYDAAAAGMPLWDRKFLAFDRALGFDWPAVMSELDRWPRVVVLLSLIYRTHGTQIVLATLVIALFGQSRQLARFLLVFMVSGALTVTLAVLMPAVGPPVLYAMKFDHLILGGPAWLEIFTALRNGSLKTINLDEMAGIVTFPSFHTVIALIVPWALRPWRWLFWPLVLIDALMIVSTVTEGGHYLADLVGGGCVFLASIALVKGVLALAASCRKPASRPADALAMPTPLGA